MEDSFFFRKAAELGTAFEKEGIPFQIIFQMAVHKKLSQRKMKICYRLESVKSVIL
jgi:hypothetical protein